MEQVQGKELAIVHEEAMSPPDVRVSQHAGDREPGAYWMYPSKEAIENMSRTQRQKVEGFQVGREHVGSVAFQVPVDLTDIELDQLYDNIVILEPRSATVYPVAAKKPPMGKGLNVPAIISLEQSWPRARDKRTRLQDQGGARFAKHVERLKRIPDTEFISYNQETGVWTFRVEHFTTYGLDDDEEEEETEGQVAPPASSSSAKQPDSARSQHTVDTDTGSPEYDPDDTFDFMQSRKSVPGAFDGTPLYDDQGLVESDQLQRVPSQSPELEESTMHEEYEGRGEDESMGDAYEEDEEVRGDELVPVPSPTEEEEGGDYHYGGSMMGGNDQQLPAGIMRARMRALKKSTAPTRIQVAGGDDWTEVLQQSVRAPRRMDRSTLRALNESGAAWDGEERGSPLPRSRNGASDGAGFATSIDLMKSLFEQAKAPLQPEQTLSSTGFVKVGAPAVY
jgi:nuclear pore complex protein Nup98-Nup96